MKNSLNNSYNRVPYLELSHYYTHPDVLATAGRLLGLQPPDIRHCRVLELGCAGGSNLIPMAVGLPDSQFIGLDASSVQIEQGRQTVERLGITNIELKAMDIMDITPEIGRFDYIIAHGLYSWVPDTVKEQILEICRRQLSESGIAYISYNTYPGWHQREILRDIMFYHTRLIDQPETKIARAREFLDFVAGAAEMTTGPTRKQPVKFPLTDIHVDILKRGSRILRDHSDIYLFHEELGEYNDPLYFYQFMERARSHGLQYLAEANFNPVFMNDIPDEVKKNLLTTAQDIIELEQYRDFITDQAFRCTLLVHDHHPLSRSINQERLSGLWAGSNCRPAVPIGDIGSRTIEKFNGASGVQLATDHPVTKAALIHLAKIWPQVIRIDDLLEAAYTGLGDSAGPFPLEGTEARNKDKQVLKANLLKGFVTSPPLIELHAYAPQLTSRVSERPLAGLWARFQVMTAIERLQSEPAGAETNIAVTNLRHERVELEGLSPLILMNLDGACDRAELLDRLEQSLKEDPTVASPDEKQDESGRPAGPADLRENLESHLEAELNWLAMAGLLMA